MRSLHRLRFGLTGLGQCLFCVVWASCLVVGSSAVCENVVVPSLGVYNLTALVGQTHFVNSSSLNHRFAICGGISDSCPGNGESEVVANWKCNTPGSAGSCHTWDGGNSSACAGVSDTEPNITAWTDADGNQGGISFKYLGGDACESCSGVARTTQIVIICDASIVGAPKLNVTDANQIDVVYTIYVEHAAGCALPVPQAPPIGSPPVAEPVNLPVVEPVNPPSAEPANPPSAEPVNPPIPPPVAEPIAPPFFCLGTKPSASFECQNGVWTLIGSLNVTDGEEIVIDSPLVIIGNLFSSNSSSITVSVGSFINVTECAIIGGVLKVIVDSAADLALLLENPLQPLLSSGCLEGEFSEIQVSQSVSDGCSQVTGATVQTTSVNHLSLLYQLDSTCDDELGEVQWYVIVAPIIAALVLGIIIFIVVAFRVPAVRNCIRPFASRSTPAAPAATETEMTTVEPAHTAAAAPPAGWTAAQPNS